MAASPLTKTPTDVMYMIFDMLLSKDLRRFRLVCRWANDQSLGPFAKRGYTNVHYRENQGDEYEFLKVFENNDGIAAAVRTVTARPKAPNYGLSFGDSHQRKQPNQPEGTWKLMEIIPKLSGLTKLAMNDISNPSLESHLSRQNDLVHQRSLHRAAQPIPILDSACRSQLTSLSLKRVRLTQQDLDNLFQLAGVLLTQLDLNQITLVDGSWIHFLCTIQAKAPNMTSLALQDLRESCGALDAFKFQDFDVTYHKAFRGQHGIEAIALRSEGVGMKGAKAVELGMDLILKRHGVRKGL
ncbi:hypothetical protein LTR56_004780 [Elasticomyces elasticus]|nr:hypothetical protein LTR56_004780 [Elasticomyces elasticus]KAK3665636.1 hypothetical protein LTR22_003576 [Elasticomyces elasticus]KAK4930326.1 hypothetical protein LTR49_003067 [Elasticomyces elasticus]KAK5768947.1 hypothetical protein LTS12_001007 [Elasticomyces elasticus]